MSGVGIMTLPVNRSTDVINQCEGELRSSSAALATGVRAPSKAPLGLLMLAALVSSFLHTSHSGPTGYWPWFVVAFALFIVPFEDLSLIFLAGNGECF